MQVGKFGTLIITALIAAACSEIPSTPTVPLQSNPSFAAAKAGVDNSYIVTFRADVADPDAVAQDLGLKHNGKAKHVYKAALKGAAYDMSAADAADVASDPRVTRVEQDQVMSIDVTQTGATWGIDRVDQHPLPLDGSYTYNNDGTGVTVYIIDTGILFGHVEFGGRAVTGIDEVTVGGTATDCNGHGTHVSGTVGGTTYGIAKNVRLVAVRVLNCQGSGTTSGVVAGIDWVTSDHNAKGGAAAANMSLGGGLSATLNQAVANSVAAGVVYAVAAGNSTANACNSSPSSEPSAITVAASDINDGFASFSNFGSCVDIIGPGVNITSSWNTSTTATNTISGTSMATPHVAGASALYLAANPGATPAAVASALTSNATANVVSGVPAGTPNKLLYTLFIGGGGPPPPPPPTTPTASFTKSCSGHTCSFTNTSTNATSYDWNFGDGSAHSTAVSPSHTYASTRATYTVTLVASDGTSSSTASQTVSCNKNHCQ
jgi:subtilisin family serine protease